MRNVRRRETPWGHEDVIWEGEGVTVKLITVTAGQRLSLQSHRERGERWVCLGPGEGLLQLDEREIPAREGTTLDIPRGAKHRITALTTDFHVLEISTGRFDQNDIIRYEDDYGRATIPWS